MYLHTARVTVNQMDTVWQTCGEKHKILLSETPKVLHTHSRRVKNENKQLKGSWHFLLLFSSTQFRYNKFVKWRRYEGICERDIDVF